MEPLKLKVSFPNIGAVSDRTARELFKDISRLCRRAQVAELEQLMEYLQLSRREKQSIRDRVSVDLSTGPVYYMKEVQTGSIEVVVVCTGLAVWLLQATIGETFKEAWKQTELHKGLVKWVTNERPSVLPEKLLDESKKHDFLSGRVYAARIESRESLKIVEIYVEIHEHVEIEDQIPILDDEILRRSEIFIKNSDVAPDE